MKLVAAITAATIAMAAGRSLAIDPAEVLAAAKAAESRIKSIDGAGHAWTETFDEKSEKWTPNGSETVVEVRLDNQPGGRFRYRVIREQLIWTDGPAPFSISSTDFSFTGELGIKVEHIGGRLDTPDDRATVTAETPLYPALQTYYRYAVGARSIGGGPTADGLSPADDLLEFLHADPKFGSVVAATEERVDDERAIRLTVRLKGRVVRSVVYLPDRGYALKSIDLTDHAEAGGPAFVVTRYQQIGEIHYPVAGETNVAANETEPRSRYRFEVDRVAINTLDLTTGRDFAISVPAGCWVTDEIAVPPKQFRVDTESPLLFSRSRWLEFTAGR